MTTSPANPEGGTASPTSHRRLVPVPEPPVIERKVLTVLETARVLGISRALAYHLVARGQLPCIRLGRRIVIPRHALDAMLKSDLSDVLQEGNRASETAPSAKNTD